MKYYLIAGERSGDFHAAHLMRELQNQDASAQFRFWGGDQMQAVGGELVRHYQDLAIMGFVEAATSILKFRGYLKQCQADLLAYKPDVLILVDYAGFNLRMAKVAKDHGIKVFYYISPKIWAWNQGRVEKVNATRDDCHFARFSGVPVCGGRREQPRPQLLPTLRAQRHPLSV
jgi:lipid-A-disaccharide synthase